MARYMKSKADKRPRKAKRVFINGDWWKLGWKKDLYFNGDYLKGLCCPTEKTILMDEDLEGLDLVNTLIHEVLHGIFPMLSEEAVERAADDIAEALAECRLVED